LHGSSIYRGSIPGEATMLAEIFMLQLEARMRASKKAIEEKKTWLFPGSLPNFGMSEPAEVKKA